MGSTGDFWRGGMWRLMYLSHSAQNPQSLEQILALSRCSISIWGRKERVSHYFTQFILLTSYPNSLKTLSSAHCSLGLEHTPNPSFVEGAIICPPSFSSKGFFSRCLLCSASVGPVPGHRSSDLPYCIEMFCLAQVFCPTRTGNSSRVGLYLFYLRIPRTQHRTWLLKATYILLLCMKLTEHDSCSNL